MALCSTAQVGPELDGNLPLRIRSVKDPCRNQSQPQRNELIEPRLPWRSRLRWRCRKLQSRTTNRAADVQGPENEGLRTLYIRSQTTTSLSCYRSYRVNKSKLLSRSCLVDKPENRARSMNGKSTMSSPAGVYPEVTLNLLPFQFESIAIRGGTGLSVLSTWEAVQHTIGQPRSRPSLYRHGHSRVTRQWSRSSWRVISLADAYCSSLRRGSERERPQMSRGINQQPCSPVAPN